MPVNTDLPQGATRYMGKSAVSDTSERILYPHSAETRSLRHLSMDGAPTPHGSKFGLSGTYAQWCRLAK